MLSYESFMKIIIGLCAVCCVALFVYHLQNAGGLTEKKSNFDVCNEVCGDKSYPAMMRVSTNGKLVECLCQVVEKSAYGECGDVTLE